MVKRRPLPAADNNKYTTPDLQKRLHNHTYLAMSCAYPLPYYNMKQYKPHNFSLITYKIRFIVSISNAGDFVEGVENNFSSSLGMGEVGSEGRRLGRIAAKAATNVIRVHRECFATPTITTTTTIIRIPVRPSVLTHLPSSATPSIRTSPPIFAPDICKHTTYI
ncbi:hypothetical protein E2C01_026466 [Portunus trituberculatus]|uniref:Uncharacterized protein n=1 Tax=Portunus trituberculatus TaxID=210409 RepID=A0A5B7EL10_PORTR|nr:hypothetical protein [Portunus trituberculatus]